MKSPLCDLADQIYALAKEHPAYSQAHTVVQNCVDHLQAIAGNEEKNRQIAGTCQHLSQKIFYESEHDALMWRCIDCDTKGLLSQDKLIETLLEHNPLLRLLNDPLAP